MGYFSNLAIDEPCDVCGGEGAHERGCPHDDWTAAAMHEDDDACRIEELHTRAAWPDEAELTTQPEGGAMADETRTTPESAYERYERLADEFHCETGLMAPGKDDPTGSRSYEERGARWVAWLAARRAPTGEP